MRLDRIVEDIYILVSDLYAHVTATILLTSKGAIVIDTIPFPHETRQILSFIERKLGPRCVRYVILTHHHADHTYGTYLFDDAEVIGQSLCREMLIKYGESSLTRAKQDTPALAEVEIRLPNITLDEEMHIHFGHRHLRLFHTPGHTPDCLSVFVADEKVLIAGDTVMPVPYFVAGDHAQMRASLEQIKALKPSFIVQGHGDVLLRGEIDDTLQGSIDYIDHIVSKVREIVRRGEPPAKLREMDIESCGKSRIPLDGLVSKLHMENLIHLYRKFNKEKEPSGRSAI